MFADDAGAVPESALLLDRFSRPFVCSHAYELLCNDVSSSNTTSRSEEDPTQEVLWTETQMQQCSMLLRRLADVYSLSHESRREVIFHI